MTEAEQNAAHAPRVAVIGGGVMGGTLISALRVAGWPATAIAIAEKNTVRANAIAEAHGIEVTEDAGEAAEGAEVVVVAVKPQDADAALKAIKPTFKEGSLVLSVAAGLPTTFFEERLGEGTPVVRAMPNTPAIVARGATAIAAGQYATDQHVAIAAGILRATGLVSTVEESDLDAVTAVSGSGPAYFYAVVEALTEAGVAQGLDRILATQLATQTFIGAAHLLEQTGETPATLRARVSSKGGTTIAALEAMESAGLQGVISVGTNAASARSKEMREEMAGN